MAKSIICGILLILPIITQAQIIILPDGTIMNCTERNKVVICI